MLLKNVSIPGNGNQLISIGTRGNKITCDFKDDFIFDFKEAIVFPGLINSHDHLEFNLFPKLGNKIYKDYVEWGEDIHLKNREVIELVKNVPYDLRFKWGLYKNLLCGVTTVAHHGKEQVIKVKDMPDIITNYNYLHSIQLENYWKLKLNLMLNSYPFVVHIGEGTNKISSNEIDELLNWNKSGRKIIGVHGISLDEKRSKKFAAIVWCPDSNLFLYNKTANITALKKETNILFGTDSTLTSHWSIWNQLRLARSLGCLNDDELFAGVTEKAASVWEYNSMSSLAENSNADIVVSKRKFDGTWNDFYSTNAEDILLILKNGRIVFLDKVYADKLNAINKTEFDLIEIKNVNKYVVKGIKELVNNICKYIPEYEFPFKVI